MHRFSPLLTCLVAVATEAAAVDTTMTQGGFTGLTITPNAHLLGWGMAEFAYDNQLPGFIANPRGHNFVAGFGLLPNLEISGRLATKNIHNNCFIQNCGIRDLSASGKASIGLDIAKRFHIAAGAADVGGAATFFRSYYGVLTFDHEQFQASAGLARRSSSNFARARSPLHGPFASAAWQPIPMVRGHVEYADSNAWAGVRVFAPTQWMPEGWSLSIGANARLNQHNLTERRWWTANLSVPLYKVPNLPGTAARAPLPPLAPGQQPLPSYQARTLPLTLQPVPSPPTAPPAPVPAAALTDALLQSTADALQSKGLEDIFVGHMPDGTVAIRAANGSYGWNTLDGLGAALGAVALILGDTRAGYRFILTQRGVPLVAVTGQADCLRNWVERRDGCSASQLSTPGKAPLEPLHADVTWVVQAQQPSWQTFRLALSPMLRTNIGSDLGAFDYSMGVNVGATLPLWNGASVEWSGNAQVRHSEDYAPGGGFSNRRVRSGTERLAMTQTLRLPVERWLGADDLQAMRWGLGAVTTQVTIGRIGHYFDGGHVALRWEPGEGQHRLSAQAGLFRNNEFEGGRGPLATLRTANPLLAHYRYSVAPTRTYLEATAGQFMFNDRGFQLGVRQWFTDVAVQVYYRRTQFSGEAARQFAGIEVSLPIGPRRDYRPLPFLQITGTPRFSHATETVVRAPINAVVAGQGVLPPAPSLETIFNSDRSGLAYFEDNIRRIRDAAR